VSSGGVDKQRLSRAGNRKLNHALHVIALSNKRYDERGAAYYAKKLAAGKGKKGALRLDAALLLGLVCGTSPDGGYATTGSGTLGWCAPDWLSPLPPRRWASGARLRGSQCERMHRTGSP